MRSIRVYNGTSGAGGGGSGGDERQLAGRYVEVFGYDDDDRVKLRVAGKEQSRILGLGHDGVEDGHQDYDRLVEAAVAAVEAEEEVGDNGDGDGDYGLQHGDFSGDEHGENPTLWQLDECFLRGEGDKASNGRDDWTEIATMALLSAWGERYLRLSRGSLRLEDWGEVARLVSAGSNMPKTDVQCKNRIDTLKKKYKSEKQKQAAIGSSVSKWPFYAALDRLLNTAREHGGLPGAVDAGEMIKTRHWRECDEDDDTTSTSDSMGASSDEDRKRPRKRKFKDATIKELSNAILKFGEIYERIESSKQQQMLDLEKVRMEFAKDLELHRMQLLMQTQIEVAKVKHSGIDGDVPISDHGVLAAINLERSTNF